MISGKQPTTPPCLGLLLLLALVGAAVVVLFAATSNASAQDATRANLPEVAVPLAKCTGTDACTGVVDLSQVADGSCNGDYACYQGTPYTGTIGAGSCNGTQTCDNVAGSIGAGSCNVAGACERAGAIGDSACNGGFACAESVGPIHAGSCNAANACDNATDRRRLVHRLPCMLLGRRCDRQQLVQYERHSVQGRNGELLSGWRLSAQ